MSLTQEQKEQFERDGCIIIPNFFSEETADQLLNRAKELVREMDLTNHPMTTFSTEENSKHASDDYFIDSGDKIRYFFEELAFTNGKLNRDAELAINKIGHCLINDPIYRQFTLSNENLIELTKSLSYHRNPVVCQSMIIAKQQQIGAKVGIHDDSTFLWTDPLSAIGYWFALEECTISNGCLSFLPGSHKINKITKRLERLPQGGTGFKSIRRSSISTITSEGVQETNFSVTSENPDWSKMPGWKTLPCRKGDLVLIHGSVIHKSEANSSPKSRWIYTFHLVEGQPFAEWSKTNWLQPTAETPFEKLYR